MNILLDENIPVQLRAALSGHVVDSVNDEKVGWKGIKNGRLLTAIEGAYDVLITADRNMYAQQNLAGRSISILVLPTNRRRDVLALRETIAKTVSDMVAGMYVIIEESGLVQTKSFTSSDDGSGRAASRGPRGRQMKMGSQ
jgi:predicted nuclease of predicted toxin-antitoxin system